ncbi:hypothetical protein NA56DRAFT_641570 [Hyaloscypha hepaticicola]|uniref:Uncharacterized protein n=1 Tax=Hyaloscypha hepaticicola TaxID=2082293 RepID=A0A2J6QKZ9_9HELO|nr:hypothetical protein NA56DRAFT_641570 [Hyaloscypha hepaticicola]
MDALALLPPRRRPVLRAGRTTNPTRPSNLEAELGQIVGQARNLRPCIYCTRGQGVWTVCVVVPGFFRGSCANCYYGSEGTRCSLRSATAAAPAPASRALTTGRYLRPATTSSSRPLSGIAPRDRIVNQVVPGTISNPLYRSRRTPAQ